MKKSSFALLGFLLLLLPMFMARGVDVCPTVNRPTELYDATIQGGDPQTYDPAWSYDTASGELLSNTYEPLIYMDGERVDMFVPILATAVPDIVNVPNALVKNLTGTGSGLGTTSYGYTQDWFWQIIFPVRVGTPFHKSGPASPDSPTGGTTPAAGTYTLTAYDVEYSYERCLVQNRRGGPTWMHWEMIFGEGVYGPTSIGDMNCTGPHPDVAMVGAMIDAAVESNATHFWINCGSGNEGGIFPPTIQIMAQTWGGILSHDWITSYVIGTLGRPEWPGTWGTYSCADWLDFRRPALSPLDQPFPVACGTGPYAFWIWDNVEEYWQLEHYAGYWGGWPAKFPGPEYPTPIPPTLGHIYPDGYVETLKVSWHYTWTARRDLFLAGDVDFCAVPRENMGEVLSQPGIRVMYPIPSLSVEGVFFQMFVEDATQWTYPAGFTLYDEGTGFHADGIPKDFFNITIGATYYGDDIRRGFAKSLDYDTLIATAMQGEAARPASALLPGLTLGPGVLYNPVPTTSSPNQYDLVAATAEFAAVPGLMDTGFTIVLAYNSDSPTRVSCAALWETAIESIDDDFQVITHAITWSEYIYAFLYGELPLWILGWLPDYPDINNYAMPFYHSEGDFGHSQLYHNPAVDALVVAGIKETDPAQRQLIYRELEDLVLIDVPSVMTILGIGRHWERDWVCGWFANSIRPGLYGYPYWKAYYAPYANDGSVPTFPAPADYKDYLFFDVDHSDFVDMDDIGLAALAAFSYYGPPQHARWNFHCDVNLDRKVDMDDIGLIALWAFEGHGCSY
jgi:peptide/nickel transport system substrate-binding protein